MIEAAVDYWHSLLTPDIAQASWEELDRALIDQRLRFGDRAICTVLRPYFLTPVESTVIQNAAQHVLSALHKVVARVPRRDWEPLLGLTPAEARLAEIDAGFRPPEAIARLDGFWTRDGRLGFVEYNAESPGGIGFGAALAKVFRRLPVAKRFQERYALHSEAVLDHSCEALLHCYREWGGTRRPPNLAIVDWLDSPTYVEFELCRAAFEALGVPTRVLGPDQLEYTNGRLHAGDYEIDLVYRRLVIMDIAARLSQDHPLVQAARERTACIASGFGGFVVHSKVMFALVSEEASRPESFLDGPERHAVLETMPWTRLVRDGRTTDWDGRDVELMEFAETHRAELVCKPATDYGGAGVTLGWTADAETWHAALRAATERPSVVQRRVALPAELFPVRGDRGTGFAEFMADIDPYAFNGRAHRGAGTRLSRSQLLNVTAGGGSAAPVFIIEPVE